MVRPAVKAAPFEVIEPEVVLQFAIPLFDRPATPGERTEVDERGGRRQMQQVVLPLVGRVAFAQQPSMYRLASPTLLSRTGL